MSEYIIIGLIVLLSIYLVSNILTFNNSIKSIVEYEKGKFPHFTDKQLTTIAKHVSCGILVIVGLTIYILSTLL